jgi:DnaJ family protein C protein 17
MTTNSEKNQLLEMDLYKLLEVEETSTVEQIKKAYRKRALELHPDKNLGNKEEAERRFIQLGKAFEILADESARAAYDAVRRQKREKEKRDEQLDDKRRKLKQDLEAREKAAREKFEKQTEHMKKSQEEERLQREVDRLRKEGSKLIEEEMSYINEQLRMEKKRNRDEGATTERKEVKPAAANQGHARLKITWSKTACDQLNEELIRHLFSKYGEIDILVMSKKTSAIIEFKDYEGGLNSLNDEKNLQEKYSISLKWLSGEKPGTETEITNDFVTIESTKPESTTHSKNLLNDEFSLNNFEDFELAILKKLHSSSNS